MKQSKQIVKRSVDLAMIVLLPLLMAEVLIGQEIHEWLGVSMLVLFLAHAFAFILRCIVQLRILLHRLILRFVYIMIIERPAHRAEIEVR